MCADHTLCMVCMVCSHHPNHTPSLSQLHADGMWIGREGEERGRRERGGAAYSFPPSHIQQAHTTPHLLSFPSFPLLTSRPHPPHTLTPSPPLTWLTTTTTSLLLPLNLPLLTHTRTHIRIPNLTQCMCQCTEETQQQQQPHYSCSSPPPAAHVLLHLHATHAHTRSKWYMCE